MPDADFSKMITPEKTAAILKKWAEGKHRPPNGSFALLKMHNGIVIPEYQ